MAVIDDDLVRAELALTELRRVRTLPFERSLAIIRHLASTTRNNGSRTQNIETARPTRGWPFHHCASKAR
jgi:hypothetical protein